MKKALILLTFLLSLTLVLAGNFSSRNVNVDTEYSSWINSQGSDETLVTPCVRDCLGVVMQGAYSTAITQDEIGTQKKLSEIKDDPFLESKSQKSDLDIATDRFYMLLDIYESTFILLKELVVTTFWVLEIYVLLWFMFEMLPNLFIMLIDYLKSKGASKNE